MSQPALRSRIGSATPGCDTSDSSLPSMRTIWPVTSLARSDSRYTTTGALASAGGPLTFEAFFRPFDAMYAALASAMRVAAMGESALTRMLNSFISADQA